MLAIQRLLRSQPWPIAREFLISRGVTPKPHPCYPQLWQFTYDQIDSDPWRATDIILESRGLILDQEDNWAVVARGFDRFFNAHETSAAQLDWDHCWVQNKLDGSLIIQYYWDHAWHVATKGSPAAAGPVCSDQDFSFQELFWQIWNRLGWDTSKLRPGWCYCWELTSQWNRIVVDQSDNPGTLTLLAVRDPQGQEHAVSEFHQDWPVVEHFALHTAEQIQAAAQALNPMCQEGFVVVDRKFRRVKIKSPRYVAIHRLRESPNLARIIELSLSAETPEVLSYFPDLRDRCEQTQQALTELSQRLEYWYGQVNHLAGADRAQRKQFALEVQARVPARYHAAMYSLGQAHAWQPGLNQPGSAWAWIQSQRVENLADILEQE